MTDTRPQADEILMQIATIQCNLGLDSSPHDHIVAKVKQGVLLNQIKTIDPEMFKILVP